METPISIIKKDHRAVEALFKEYESLGEKAYESKKEVANKIIEELTLHAKMEEKIFYPRLKEAFSHDDDKLVEEADAEHHAAKLTMLELKVLSVENPQFDAKVTVLKEMIEHHVKEEEEEMLPLSEKKVSEDMMNTMAQEMKEFKENADKNFIEKLLS